MTFRQFIILIALATAALWGGWAWVLVQVDPFATNWIGFFLFYSSLFMALVGTFTLVGVFTRHLRAQQALLFHSVLLSVRQAVVLAIFFVFLLLLQAQRLLSWWSLALLFILLFAFEFFVLSKERRFYPSDNPKTRPDGPVSDAPVLPTFQRRRLEDGGEPSSLIHADFAE